MIFSQKISVKRRREFVEEFIQGAWSPEIIDWLDIIEDFLSISRKRINNKFALFRLQLTIVTDLVHNCGAIDSYKKRLDEIKIKNDNGSLSNDEYNADKKFIENQIFSYEVINRALKEIMDGIVWRLLKYNRAILFLLADKEAIGPIRIDKGMIETIYELGDIFLSPDYIAILNDITNFLRIGDVTKIDNDGNIELIEVKSSGKKRGRRISRQKQRMCEVVEFINTGIKEYDNKKYVLLDSNITQIHYFKNLLDSISRAQIKGYDSILIGDYLILEVAINEIIDDTKKMIEFFENKHKSVKDSWKKKKDLIISTFYVEKLQYSKNYIPYSILPFDNKICTNIIMGNIWVRATINISEIFRKINKAGWEIIDSIFLRPDDELEKMDNDYIKNIPILEIKRNKYISTVPSNYLLKLIFELWSPKTMIEVIEESYVKRRQNDYDAYLINFIDDQRIWK